MCGILTLFKLHCTTVDDADMISEPNENDIAEKNNSIVFMLQVFNGRLKYSFSIPIP